MSNGKTPQTEAQALELLNASITRETVRGAVENFLGASKEAAKQDAGRAPFDELAYARLVAADPSTSDSEEFDITTIRALVTEIDRLSATYGREHYVDSGDLDTTDIWRARATRACEMLNKRSEQLREMTAERDALKAREELAQTSLRLLTTALKLQNERAEKAEARTLKVEGYVRELRTGLHALRDESQLWLDDGDKYMDRIDTERAKEQAQAAESRRNAAVSDAGPANDVALKVTE